MFAGALLLAAGLSSLGFAQKTGLKFNPDKKFKIVQFTDLHVKWQDPRSDIAFERMNQVLDDEKPDLVIFTGDIIYSKPALENMRNVLKTVSDRKIPFSIVFGNHDNEQGATKEELLKVAESLPYSLTGERRFLLWLSYILRCRSLIKRLPMRMPNSMAYVGKRHALRP